MLNGNDVVLPVLTSRTRMAVVACGILAIVIIAGCDRQVTQTTQPERTVGRAGNFVVSARQILASQDRGIENEWLAIEALLPGFGGMSLDSGGDVRVYLKNLADSEACLTAMTSFRQRRPDVFQRPDGRQARIRFVQGSFAFSDLVSYSNALTPTFRPHTGFRFIDADEALNRVRIGVADVTSEAAILAQARQLGIPDSAITFDLVPGAIELADSVTQRLRPTKAGIQTLALVDTGLAFCTLGFNVSDPGGRYYFLTAGHCTDNYQGPTNERWYQATTDSVGREAINPAWRTVGCVGWDICDTADAAAIQYNADTTVTHANLVVQTATVGSGISYGSLDIDSTFVIGAWRTAMTNSYVYKTGMASGTTKGQVIGSCVNVSVDSASPTRFLFCQRQAQMQWRHGDSGGPVYQWGTPLVFTARYGLGIVWGGYAYNWPHLPFIYYSEIPGVQSRLGVSLTPCC